MAPLQGLVAENWKLVLEMAPRQGLVTDILRVVLEKAPLQGLEIEKWEMRYLFTPNNDVNCQVKYDDNMAHR